MLLLGKDLVFITCRAQNNVFLRWYTFTYTNMSLSKKIIKIHGHYSCAFNLSNRKSLKVLYLCTSNIHFSIPNVSNIHSPSRVPCFSSLGEMKISKLRSLYILVFSFFCPESRLTLKVYPSLKAFHQHGCWFKQRWVLACALFWESVCGLLFSMWSP